MGTTLTADERHVEILEERLDERSYSVSEVEESDEERLMDKSSTIIEEESTLWFGYKFVGDNLDRNIKPSFQRQESHTGQSLHYFHGYAVQDRVDLSCYSNANPPCTTPDPSAILPSAADFSALKDELDVLISR